MKRYSEDARRALVREFEAGDMTAAAFCRQVGISVATLGLWRRRLGMNSQRRSGPPSAPAPAPAPVPAPQWVPVIVGGSGVAVGSGGGNTLSGYVLTSGAIRLEVPQGFDCGEAAALWRMAMEPTGQEVRS